MDTAYRMGEHLSLPSMKKTLEKNILPYLGMPLLCWYMKVNPEMVKPSDKIRNYNLSFKPL